MGYNTIRCPKNAPLAQLVEQLTLNQWVQGSSPWRCTKRKQKRTPPSGRGSFCFRSMRRSRLRTPNMRGRAVHIPSVSPRHSKTFRFVVRDAGSESRASMGSVFSEPRICAAVPRIFQASRPGTAKAPLLVVRDAGSESQAPATFETIQSPAPASSERFGSLLMIRRDGKGKTGVVKGMCFGSFFFFKEEFVSCRQITHYMEH